MSRLPFPEGQSHLTKTGLRLKAKGILDTELEDKIIVIEGMTEADILEIRNNIQKEVKRQNGL